MLEHSKYFDKFSSFFSASSTQLFLQKCYRHEKIADDERHSYNNCYPFIYHLEHARSYYDQAAIAPLSIQPILNFYGFIQLLKACLLSADPGYPESTAQLAHGVTSRKRKKQHYDFLEDEVKIQKHGLFTCISEKIFQLKYLEGEKFAMGVLLKEIPDMQTLAWNKSSSNFVPLLPDFQGFKVQNSLLDRFQMSKDRLEGFLRGHTDDSLCLTEDSDFLHLQLGRHFSCNGSLPFRYNLEEERFMLSLNRHSPIYSLPELLIHYLISYNLSMIARYETEWWVELLKTTPNDDYPAIVQFLKVSQKKVPYLVFEWLVKERFNS